MGLRDVVNQRREQKNKPRTLAELRARKQAQVIVPMPEKPDNSLAGVKARKLASASAKRDFRRGGLHYGNVQQINGYWTIDVTNGDRSFTLHNRHGAWFHDIDGREGVMAEPVRVARALGTQVGQLEISAALIERMEIEQKARGILTHDERIRLHEREAIEARKKKRKKNDNNDDTEQE